MARLERFRSVFDEFQNGFERGFKREVDMAVLIQNARAQYSQEQRQIANTNMDIIKFNSKMPVVAAANNRDLSILTDARSRDIDGLRLDQLRADQETKARGSIVNDALSRGDFATASRQTGREYRYRPDGGIESRVAGGLWTVGGLESSIYDQSQQLLKAGNAAQLNALNGIGSTPSTSATVSPDSVVRVQRKPVAQASTSPFPLTGGATRGPAVSDAQVDIYSSVMADGLARPKNNQELTQAGLIPPAVQQSPYGDFTLGKGARPMAAQPSKVSGVKAQIEALKAQLALEPDPAIRFQLSSRILALRQQI